MVVTGGDEKKVSQTKEEPRIYNFDGTKNILLAKNSQANQAKID